MKISFLTKIVIISIFISFAIISDIFCSAIIFFKMPFGGKLFKFSFVILFLSGFYLGFQKGFIVCIFYSFFHLGKFLLNFSLFTKIFSYNLRDIFLTSLFDFLIPDIIISFSGLKYKKQKENINNYFNFINILKLISFISFLRLLSFFISSYYVYAPKIVNKFNSLNLSNNYFFYLFNPNNKLYLFCFLYCFVPVLTNLVFSTLLVLFFNLRFKYILDKYN
ncbi:hypothetical protein [Candidatus Phytoplasma sacchari]|uniref:ECF transporter S component n=1 Tax=Candidatus Phytoplasma sacchari TaxID=2609813 RepID=A0ABY7M2Z8_9MOLU|nr:hypothetical protein O7R10_02085 [Candidatus Phytoplasma sacchari]